MTRTILLPVLLNGQNIPKRPPLNGADTNQAAAYYQYGLSMLQQDPRIADVQRRLAGLTGAAPNQ